MVRIDFDEEFYLLIKKAVSEVLDERLQSLRPDNVPNAAAPTHVSKKEAARLLGCSQGTVDNFARAGKLKRSYLGKSVKFERAQVLGLTRSHTNSKQ